MKASWLYLAGAFLCSVQVGMAAKVSIVSLVAVVVLIGVLFWRFTQTLKESE